MPLSTVLYYELAMKVPIPVGITVYLLTWGLGHLRCLVFFLGGGRLPPPKKSVTPPPKKICADFIFIHPEPLPLGYSPSQSPSTLPQKVKSCRKPCLCGIRRKHSLIKQCTCMLNLALKNIVSLSCVLNQ